MNSQKGKGLICDYLCELIILNKLLFISISFIILLDHLYLDFSTFDTGVLVSSQLSFIHQVPPSSEVIFPDFT